MKINGDILNASLALLGELLPQDESHHFVICGGSSLIALNLIHRTTEDVDILAKVDSQQRLIISQASAGNREERGKENRRRV